MNIGPFRKREKCALCRGTTLQNVLSLPATPLANEFVRDIEVGFLAQNGGQEVFPLELVLCGDCQHLQMETLVDPTRLFKNYVYATGTSPVTVAHFKEQAEFISRIFLAHLESEKGQDHLIVEIGSNDGTLLREFKNLGYQNILGVDPAEAIARKATASGIRTLNTFFTSDIAEQILVTRGTASVVIANNVFAHAEDIREISEGVKMLIGKTGLFVFEVSHLLDMSETMAFDTIYHEHFSYHALKPLVKMFDVMGMKIIDVERREEQRGRGSLRVYVASQESKLQPLKNVIESILHQEEQSGILGREFYTGLKAKIVEHGAQIKAYLNDVLESGKEIIGYGAPAKMTTLMYAFGLEGKHCKFVVDDSSWKQELFTPGLHIPVVSSSELKEAGNKMIVIYAWNFADSIVGKHGEKGFDFFVPTIPARVIYPRKLNQC